VRLTQRLCSGLALAVAVASIAVDSHAAGSTWSLVSSKNATSRQGSLSAVACAASDDCTAVGSHTNGAGDVVTLAERWNGASWAIQPTANPPGALASTLQGVSCPSASLCIAVGTSYDGTRWMNLAESWDGTSWTIQPTAQPDGSTTNGLIAVSCAATTVCMAVGQATSGGTTVTNTTLVESWNGTSWSIQPTPDSGTDASLDGVSCTAPNACTAVGYVISGNTAAPLAERWDGASWTIQTTPNPEGAERTYLSAVSCPAFAACTAVGSYADSGGTHVLAESWDGASWAAEATPRPARSSDSSFSGVSCATAAACVAVGFSVPNKGGAGMTLAESWNGSSWVVEGTHHHAGATGSFLAGVSCAAPGACTAVGADLSDLPTMGGVRDVTPPGTGGAGGGISVTLAEAWNGNSWSLRSTVNPSGALSSSLSAVSCTSATACTAVGGHGTASSDTATLAEVWNGKSWTVQHTIDPGTLSSELLSVSCVASFCMAVGDSGGGAVTLAEAWNGTSWSVQSTPNPSGATGSSFAGVSCTSATQCIAVGSSFNSSGGEVTLSETWDGASWTILSTPSPAAAFSYLASVSCKSATACTSVGGDRQDMEGQTTLAESWNGVSWAIQSTPNPAAYGSSLSAVSCTSGSACTAVGSSDSDSRVALAETWDGTSWAIQPTPEPSGAHASDLSAVSCTAPAACVAVGYRSVGDGPATTLAETWDGTSWSVAPTPNPSVTVVDSYLSGVSCAAATVCMANGYSLAYQGDVTLAERYR
jgi:hypothetical protein